MDKIIGITAEYNPFHKGHLHQLNELRRLCPDAGIVAVLSTDFLQRGVPALMDKWERARAAVLCGADLVLELPAPFCCNNAGVFASGAVALFRAAGIIDGLSFGMEDHTELLRIIPDILVQEPSAFKAHLHFFLKKGRSYAEARALAVEQLCPGAAELLSRPNNTLAFAYVEAMMRQNADFELLPVVRTGAGYHDADEASVMSASGIRAALATGRVATALAAMPAASGDVLQEAASAGRLCLGTGKLWEYLRFLLMRATPEELADIAGMDEGIENRFLHAYKSCSSFEGLVEKAAARRYPRTRLQRHLTALLLGFKKEDDREFQRHGPAYLRPLAMNGRGRAMLAAMRKRAALPIITKPAALKGNNYAQKILDFEFRAARLREALLPSPDFDREVRAVPFIAPQD